MEQLLNNTPINWVQVTDPSTGRIYYAPDSYVYSFKNNEEKLNLEGVNLEGSSNESLNTGSLLITASFFNPNLEFEKGDKSGFTIDLSSLIVTNAYTASYINGGEF